MADKASDTDTGDSGVSHVVNLATNDYPDPATTEKYTLETLDTGVYSSEDESAAGQTPSASNEVLPSFEGLLHKSYAQNRQGMDSLREIVIYMEQPSAIRILDSLERFAARHRDNRLVLETELSKAYYYCLYDVQIEGMTAPGQSNMYRFGSILERALKERNIPMELNAYYWLALCARNNLNNYELALDYYRLMRESLKKITQEEFPEKVYYMLIVANAYLEFADYDRAAGAYREIIGCEVTPKSENYIISAKNSIGLIYRQKEMADSSNYWFGQVLSSTEASRWPEWEGIASSNLGANYLIQRDTLRAEPLIKFALTRALEYNDPGMIIANAIYLADICLGRKEPAEAEGYLATAWKYIEMYGDLYNDKEPYYRALSKYHILKNEPSRAIAYQDSAYAAQKARSKDYSASLLVRMEQKDHLRKQELSEVELRQKRSQLNIVLTGLLMVTALLIFCIYLYNQKRKAYRELVRRGRRWAGVALPGDPSADGLAEDDNPPGSGGAGTEPAGNRPPDKDDIVLMDEIERLVAGTKLYTYPDLTLDSLAARLEVNRYYVSGALNRCSGKNFNQYINEYRVKEAIRLISDPAHRDLSIDGLAIESGFNDRKSFYRAFKKSTGLSPSDFIKNNRGA